jgi:O-antigen ligase
VTVITVFGFIFAFFAILQGILSPTKIFGIYERQFATPYGTFVNRHNFAAYMEMALALPLAMVMAGGVRRDMRLLFLTAVSLMAVALVLSGSRGGLVALLAELIVLALMTARTSGRRSFVLKLALAAVLVAAVVGGAIFVGGESSLTRIAETASSKDVTTSRTQIWATTLLVIAGNLPFGTGLGALGVAYTPVDKMSGLERVEQAHNDYLQVVSDAGIVGLIIGGVFLYLLIRTAVRNIRRQNDLRRSVSIGAAAGIFAILVHSIFDFVLHTTAVSVLFLVLVALLSAAGRKYDDDIVTDDRDRRHRRKGSVHSISTRRA